MISQMKTMQSDPLTGRIISCCFKVHSALGPGFPEKLYSAALMRSLQDSQLFVETEKRFTVVFEGNSVGVFRVDVLVEDRVILEVKAITGAMPKIFSAQLLAYLKAANKPVGLLVNFGNSSCQVKRTVFSSVKSIVKSAESIHAH